MKTKKYFLHINACDTLCFSVALSKTEYSRKLKELFDQAQQADHPDFPVEVENTYDLCNHAHRYRHRFRIGMYDTTLEELICEPGYCFSK